MPPAASPTGAGRPAQAWVAALRALGALLQRLPRPSYALLALGWMGMISGLSSLSGVGRGGPVALGYLFNLGHALLFGLLAAWLALCLPRSGGWPRLARRETLAVLGVVLTFALFDEWRQGHVPGRDASPIDLVTDLTGAACLLWIVAFVARREAGDGGLRLRLALGLAACALAAALATWPPLAVGGAAGL